MKLKVHYLLVYFITLRSRACLKDTIRSDFIVEGYKVFIKKPSKVVNIKPYYKLSLCPPEMLSKLLDLYYSIPPLTKHFYEKKATNTTK